MATAATTLWTLATVRSWMGITASDTDSDTDLTLIADAVTEFIERETRRKFVTRAVTETLDGNGEKVLFLADYPVTTFTSLRIRRSPADADGSIETISTDSYRVNLPTGKLWTHSDVLTAGIGNIFLSYSTGYGAQGAATLPQDIVVAGLEIVKSMFTEKTTGAAAASSISLGSNTFMLKPDWPKAVKDTLNHWKRL